MNKKNYDDDKVQNRHKMFQKVADGAKAVLPAVGAVVFTIVKFVIKRKP